MRTRLAAIAFFIIFGAFDLIAQEDQFIDTDKVAEQFKLMLERPHVAFSPSLEVVKADSIIVEKGYIFSELEEKVPILIYKPVRATQQLFPAVICLHGTGGSKSQKDILEILKGLCRRGIMGISIDARYHGDRIRQSKSNYVDAISRAWQNSDPARQEHPFFYDTVYDIWRLTDYLVTRPDVDAKRIGMTGISMGGIETWMAASVDKRIKVAVPMIAAQSFKWSLENDLWQGRARTIWAAHVQTAKDLGDSVVKKENVKTLWDKVVPGITSQFDCPSMVRLFAPRPLLFLSSEKDLNCPLEGAKLAFKAATEAYNSAKSAEKLKIYVAPNQPHRVTPEHIEMMFNWFSRWL